MAEELGMRMRLDGVVETTNGIALTGSETEKLAKKLDQGSKALDGMAVSAGQTRQAMRQLPMQITDIATSLASGMPAWLVFVQQGGQIRDSFGGAVPALRAIAGTFTPLTAGATAAGAALAAYTAVLMAGERESSAFHRALILTGNASGTTTDQLTNMSRALAQVNGTQSENAAAMASLASTGRVAGDALQMATRAAVALEQAAGVSVKETVRQFAELGKDPVKASAALNEQTNFLTKSVFDQIVQLKAQGKESEAATVAQKAYAEAVIQRSDAIKANLGNLETAWLKVGEGAKWAWDRMLDVGRKDTNQQSLEKLSNKLAENRALLQKNLATGGGEAAGAPGKSQNDVIRDTIQNLERRAFEVNRAIDRENTNALQKAEESVEVRKHIEDKLNPPKTGGAKAKRPSELMGPPTFDEMWPAADAKSIISQRSADRQARVQELESYDAVEKARRYEAIKDEAQLRKEREEGAEAYLRAIQKSEEAWAKAMEKEREATQRRRDAIADSIYDGILNGFRDGQNPAEIFLRELKAQFARTVLRVPVQFLSTAMDQAGVSFGNALMGLFGGLGGLPDYNGSGLLEAGRASGGPVGARSVRPVAEEGPEMLRVGGRSMLMMGSKDGFVHSASATRAMVGGRAINSTVNINIDSRTDRSEIHQMVVRAVQVGQSDLLQRMDRGEV